MAPDDEDLVVNARVTIPASELAWRFHASSGPGGQHVNKTNSRVELRFDVAGSTSLPEDVRARLLERLGAHVRVVVQDERSQYRNRVAARARLAERLAAALVVERPRRATRPGIGAVERRMREKHENAQRKTRRRVPRDLED